MESSKEKEKGLDSEWTVTAETAGATTGTEWETPQS